MSADLKLAVERAARGVVEEDIATGRIRRTNDRMPRTVITASSARILDYEMDVTGYVHNPTAAYPTELLQRAACAASRDGLATFGVDPLGAMVRQLARDLKLPLTVTVTTESKRSPRQAGKVAGRLVDLVVLLTAAISNLNLPSFRLPDDAVDVSASGVRRAIERARQEG
jgi:hypothetical protein